VSTSGQWRPNTSLEHDHSSSVARAENVQQKTHPKKSNSSSPRSPRQNNTARSPTRHSDGETLPANKTNNLKIHTRTAASDLLLKKTEKSEKNTPIHTTVNVKNRKKTLARAESVGSISIYNNMSIYDSDNLPLSVRSKNLSDSIRRKNQSQMVTEIKGLKSVQMKMEV
jgi:hypothetical protein